MWSHQVSALVFKHVKYIQSSPVLPGLILFAGPIAYMLAIASNSALRQELSVEDMPFMLPAFMAAFSITLVSFIFGLVSSEKLQKTMGVLRRLGLHESAYWTSLVVILLSLILPSSLLSALFWKYVPLFEGTSKSELLPLLLINLSFTVAMGGYSLVIASMMSRPASLNGVKVLLSPVILISTMMYSSMSSESPVTSGQPYYMHQIGDSLCKRFFIGFFAPWIEYAKCFLDIYSKTIAQEVNGEKVAEFTWNAFVNPPYASLTANLLGENLGPVYDMDLGFIPATEEQIGNLFNRLQSFHSTFSSVTQFWIQLLVYIVLAWYLNQALPSLDGMSTVWYFPFSPRYWGFVSTDASNNAEKQKSIEIQGIIVQGLTKTYGYKDAVNKVSLTMEQGNIYALLGHNGAGKSTLMKMLSGITKPTNGSAFICGYDIHSELGKIQQHIGMCPQEDLLFEHLTALEHIKFYTTFRNVDVTALGGLEEYALRKLKSIDLDQKINEKVGGYSGGMKRRMSLILATIGTNKVIFLDEPTTGLDPVTKKKCWDVIRDLKNECVVILTTHYMEEAEHFGDQVVMMIGGKTVAQGTPLELTTKYGRGFQITLTIKNLSLGIKRCDIEAWALSCLPGSDIISSEGATVLVGLGRQQTAYLTPFFDCVGHEGFFDWSVASSNLEEVFLRSTEGLGRPPAYTKQTRASKMILFREYIKKNGFSLHDESKADTLEISFSDSRFKSQFMAVFKLYFRLVIESWKVYAIYAVVIVSLNAASAIFLDDPGTEFFRFTLRVMEILLILPNLASALTLEKESGLLKLQRMQGMQYKSFWLGKHLAMICHTLLILLVPLTCGLVMQLIPFEIGLHMCLFYILAAQTTVCCAVIIASLFSKSNMAAFGAVLVLLFGTLSAGIKTRMNGNSSRPSSRFEEDSFISAFPPMGLQNTLYLAYANVKTEDDVQFSPEPEIKRNFLAAFLRSCALMLIGSLIFSFIGWAIYGKQPRTTSRFARCKKGTKSIDIEGDHMRPVDDDVLKEAREIARSSPSKDEAIRFVSVTRKYGQKVAVDDISLRIKYGESFGMLGPNGAGKTTLVSMLHEDFGNDGTILLGGEKHTPEVASQIGACPQFDILWDQLTVEGHLDFFARLRGVIEHDIQPWVSHLARLVSLDGEHFSKTAGSLSGGMRRRLSIAISMIGNPRILVLDEPASGLDPVTRRQVWHAIEAFRDPTRSVVIITHSMEEADALCTRIGLVSNGKLAALGSRSHLKNKFGDGPSFTLGMLIDTPQSSEKPQTDQLVRSAIGSLEHNVKKNLMSHARVVDYTTSPRSQNTAVQIMVKFAVPKALKDDMAPMFAKMDHECKKLGVSDWSFSETSMEEVFIKIVEREEK